MLPFKFNSLGVATFPEAMELIGRPVSYNNFEPAYLLWVLIKMQAKQCQSKLFDNSKRLFIQDKKRFREEAELCKSGKSLNSFLIWTAYQMP